MSKVSPLINNFSAGEFGPLTSARVDLDRYGQSAEEMTNFIPTIQGAAQKRGGTKYVAKAKTVATNCRLEKFIFSNEQAYILEIGQAYIRFYTDGAQIIDGGLPVEIATSYLSDDIFELSFCQSNDVLYIFHENYEPQKLIRSSDISWSIEKIVFQDGPWGPANQSYTNARKDLRYLTPSSPIVGGYGIYLEKNTTAIVSFANNGGYTQVTLGSNMLPFLGEKIYIRYPLGLGNLMTIFTVKSVDSETTFTLDVLYSSFSPASGVVYWTPQEDEGRYIRVLDSSGVWGIAEIIGDDDRVGAVGKESYKINVLSSLTSNGQKKAWRFSLQQANLNFSSACFYEDRLFLGGPYQYISASKSSDYENFAPSALDGVVTDSNGFSFSLNSNDTNNIKWVSTHENAVLVGTSANEWIVKSASSQSAITPTSITAKKTSSFGSKSIQPVQSGKATIFAQASGRKLREFNYFFDVDGFRCQDLNQLSHHIAKFGITQLSLQKQPDQVVWASRNDGLLLGLTYERDVDGLRVAWHKHQIGGYRNTNNDLAQVFSVASIPTSDSSYDQVWILVGRLINGIYSYSIEYFSNPFSDETEQEDMLFLDCSLTYNSSIGINDVTRSNPAIVTSISHGLNNSDLVRFDDVRGMIELNGNIYKVANVTANTFELTNTDGENIDTTSFSIYFEGGKIRKLVTTISGLTHLNGQQVTALCDGGYGGVYTVSSGTITLNDPAAVVTVGLSYQARLKLPRLEAGSNNGTSLGKTRRIHRLGAIVYRTTDLKYGQDFDEMNNFEIQDADDQLNQAPVLYTGVLTSEANFQYDFDNNICLMNDRPTNCTVLAVMPNLDTQDR